MSSLKRRAIAVVLVAELMCAVAFSGSALLHERRTRVRAFDETLEGRSDSLLGAIQDAEDPEDNVAIDPEELTVSSQDVYAVYNFGGRLLGMSNDAAPILTARSTDGFRDVRSAGHHYRVYQRHALRIIDRAETRGLGLQRPVTIVYAAPVDHLWHEILEAAEFYLVVSLTLLTGTAGVMILLLRNVLRPVQDLATEAGKVSMNSLRFEAPPSALALGELRPLAQTLSSTIASLEQAFQKQHRFVSDSAHELKTAVAVVRSTIQVLMLRSRSASEYEEGLERLLMDNDRVEDLVSQMLKLARLEEANETVYVASDLAKSVQCAIDRLAPYAEEHTIQLLTTLTDGISVRLPEEQAETLVSNLIVNAVQHSQRGSAVEIKLIRDSGCAMLQVRDQGSGISSVAQPYVFDRFFREDASRSRHTGGAGLGLAICKAIVEKAGGSISLVSAEGEGTTVTATFRLV